MAKPEDQLYGYLRPGNEIGEATPVDEHSDMADLGSAAFAIDLANLADTMSCPAKESK